MHSTDKSHPNNLFLGRIFYETHHLCRNSASDILFKLRTLVGDFQSICNQVFVSTRDDG